MQCEIRSMSEEQRGPRTDDGTVVPKEGLVHQVCREWLVHEDSAFAHRLQEEEIEMHYGMNRKERKVVREDLQQARCLQEEEEVDAATVREIYEQILTEQEEIDAKIALEMQEKEKQELEQKMHLEEADKELARLLQEKERLRLEKKKRERELMKERKQVEKARAQCSENEDQLSPDLSLGHHYEEPLCSDLRLANLNESPGNPENTYNDLTDFCIKPSPDMDHEAIRRLQEEQDAELARLLQEQETKRCGYSNRDRQLAIEAQDRELARLLQEQERAKARRAKERARQKALQRQAEQNNPEGGKQNGAGSPTYARPAEISSEHPSLEIECLDSPTNGRGSKTHRPLDLDVSSQHSSQDFSRHMKDSSMRRRSPSLSSADSGEKSVPEIPNIAMAIDPTYNCKKQAAVLSTASASSQAGGDSGGSTPVLPSPISFRTGTYHGDDGYYDSDEGPAPPYMPIQGQRRSSSLEKKKKAKASKDGCRQQ